MGVIYKITNIINNKIYIGKTIDIKKRIAKYKRSLNRSSSQIIIKSMMKYGFENFVFEVVDETDILEELNNKEKYYIKLYDSMNTKIGYNMTSGGDGGDTISNHPDKNIILKKRDVKISGINSYLYRHDLEEHIEEMIELNSIGMSANDLAKKFNCSEKAIRSRIPNYNNISSSNHNKGNESYQYRHDLDENINKIIEMRNQKITIKNICKIFNCSTKALYKRLNQLKK